MQKRRERIEQWRAARKAKQEDVVGVEALVPESKKWTLEDEEDEDAENNDVAAAAQNGETAVVEDVDPLDAYMQVIITSLVRVSRFLPRVVYSGLVAQRLGHWIRDRKVHLSIFS